MANPNLVRKPAVDSGGVGEISQAQLLATAIEQERNHIINGNFDFWQRGTSFSPVSSTTFAADRWSSHFVNSATRTISRSTSVPNTGSNFSYQYVVGTADAAVATGDYEHFLYAMEGYDFANIYGKTFTLSFWVFSSVTGKMPISMRNATLSRSYVANVDINVANTWIKRSITITHDTTGTWNTDNTVGAYFTFGMQGGTQFQLANSTWGNGNFFHTSDGWNFMGTAGATFRISQVQINVGTNSPSFQAYGQTFNRELEACQRYFEKSYNLADTPGTITRTGMRGIDAASTASSSQLFQVRKRANPTMTVYNPDTGTVGQVREINTLGNNPPMVDRAALTYNPGEYGFLIEVANSTDNQLQTFHFTADAEL